MRRAGRDGSCEEGTEAATLLGSERRRRGDNLIEVRTARIGQLEGPLHDVTPAICG